MIIIMKRDKMSHIYPKNQKSLSPLFDNVLHSTSSLPSSHKGDKSITSTRHLSRFQHIIPLIHSIINKYIWPKWTKHRSNYHHHYHHHFSSSIFPIFYLKRFLLLSIIMCLLPTFIISEECKFPEHWWGSWFQKGVSDTISITSNNISHKGFCRENQGDNKYIIENRIEKCIRCLVISERHANILQYKETSVCYTSKDLNQICFEINGDAPLYSLYRVNTNPIKCPFKGPFTFSYLKGSANECKDPLSSIDECTDDLHMLFKFRACIDISGSESKVEQLECLADWKEGSNRYLVGKLYHQQATTDEDRFRCFIIEKNNSDYVESYNIGQSGDASCEGLFAPRDGSRTFKLRKSYQVEPRCEFPSWITESSRWTTLDNRHVYDFSSLNRLTVYDVKHEIFKTAKCIRSEDVSFLYRFNTSQFIIHTTVQCSSGYACMHAYQREDRIIELQIGNIVSDLTDACSPTNFNFRPTNYITLTTLDQETRPCGLSGIYSIRTKMPYSYSNKIIANYSRLVSLLDSRFMCQEKALRLKSNCHEPNLFQFICTTDNRVKNFYCRGGWRENHTQFILVSLMDKFNYEYCIAYNSESQEIRLIRNSHFCYRSDNNFDWMVQQERPGFRPSTNVDYPKYAPKYDDSISFTLINEGSCQRSGSTIGSRTNFNPQSIQFQMVLFLSIAVVLNLFFHSYTCRF